MVLYISFLAWSLSHFLFRLKHLPDTEREKILNQRYEAREKKKEYEKLQEFQAKMKQSAGLLLIVSFSLFYLFTRSRKTHISDTYRNG